MQVAFALHGRHLAPRSRADKASQRPVTSAFNGKNRVRHEPQREAALAQFREGGVEQERHVVVHNLDDRPAHQGGGMHADFGDPRLALGEIGCRRLGINP